MCQCEVYLLPLCRNLLMLNGTLGSNTTKEHNQALRLDNRFDTLTTYFNIYKNLWLKCALMQFKHYFLAYILCTAIRSLDDDFFRRRRLPSSWCSTRCSTRLGAVTFTMAVTCLTATCLEKKHTLPPAISFPKDQQPWFMHPYSRCATVLYTHTQLQCTDTDNHRAVKYS